MLARAGFGDDARLAHAPGEQYLAHAVIDLVRSRVEQVFPLEIDLRPTEFPSEPFGEVKRGGPAAEFSQVVIELTLELRVRLRAEILGLQLLQRVHQGLRHVPAPIRAEMSMRIRHSVSGNRAHVPEVSPQGRVRRAHR